MEQKVEFKKPEPKVVYVEKPVPLTVVGGTI
jgi:hypothetical protein